MIEIWKDIKGYENLYQISNMGRVKSLERIIIRCDNKTQTIKEKILKTRIGNNGYYTIILSKKGEIKKIDIHRLIAIAFIPNPDNKPCIDHINGDRTDNRIENLRWVTQKENINNPISISKMKNNHHLKNTFGAEHPLSKPILQFTLDGKLVRKWESAVDIKKELGFNNCHISSCCNGKRKTANGYIWKYYYKGIWLKNHIPLKDKKVA